MEQNEIPLEVKVLTKKRRHKQDRLLKRVNVGLEADSKKKREAVYKKMDIEAESMPENGTEDKIEEHQLYEENREGLEEYDYLLKDKDGNVHIDNETEFSDGWRADGSYKDGYWREPSPEELKQIEFEEKMEADRVIKERNFEKNKTGGGKRLGSQRVRTIR
jgi:hypothetical protein